MTAAAAGSRLPALALGLLLALSAWLQFTVVAGTDVAAPLRADAGDYYSYAANLSELGVYSRAPRWREPQAVASPDKARPPGYPLVLRLAGRPEASLAWLHKVALLQAGLGVLSTLLCYLVAARFLRWPLALLAGLLFAVNPWLSTANAYLLTEPLYTCLLFAAVWVSLRLLEAGAPPRLALLAGMIWGAGALVRPTTEYLVPLLFAGTLLLPAWRAWHRPAALALLGFVLVMSPWWLRNLSVPATPGQSQLANAIVHGAYPGFRYEGREDSYGYPYRYDPESGPAQRDVGSALRFVARRAGAHPLEYAGWYLFGKPYYFLSLKDVQSFDIEIFPLRSTPYYERFEFAMLRMGMHALHAPLVLLGLLAMFALAVAPARLRLSPEARRAASLLACVLAFAIALHMLAAPFPRYAVPFRPLLYALALLPLQAAWLAWRARRAASANVAAA